MQRSNQQASDKLQQQEAQSTARQCVCVRVHATRWRHEAFTDSVGGCRRWASNLGQVSPVFSQGPSPLLPLLSLSHSTYNFSLFYLSPPPTVSSLCAPLRLCLLLLARPERGRAREVEGDRGRERVEGRGKERGRAQRQAHRSCVPTVQVK